MFPKNLTLFRFPAAPSDDVAGALAGYRVRDVGHLEMFTSGFASPFGRADGALTVEAANRIGFVHERQEKLLPGSVVNDALAKKVQAIADEEDRKVGGRERKRIREDLVNEMLPHAPVRRVRTFGWLDVGNRWLVLATNSRRRAEEVISSLREAFGSFPAVPLAPEESPRVLLSDWLAKGELPEAIAFGDECELRDPATSTGSIVRCRRQELDSEEMREHLRNGKQVFQLGLVFKERMLMVLGDDLVVRKVKPLDVLLDEQDEAEGAESQLQSDFALAALEVGALLAWIETTFGVPCPVEA